jgi:hypothetical protein
MVAFPGDRPTPARSWHSAGPVGSGEVCEWPRMAYSPPCDRAGPIRRRLLTSLRNRAACQHHRRSLALRGGPLGYHRHGLADVGCGGHVAQIT